VTYDEGREIDRERERGGRQIEKDREMESGD
jgi:hypothetical protein